MTYELWDVCVGVGIASYTIESEMKKLVQSFVTHHGEDQKNCLAVSVSGSTGVQEEILTGDRLLSWCREGAE